jgi:microcystin-dependent protein
MSDFFVAEIRMFGCNFAPTGWATCDGQLMTISQNTALFSLLGVTYGGDGKSTFALPNFQGSAPLQQGQGPGLSLRDLGETGGEESITLLQTEMPAHSHTANAATSGGQQDPLSNTWGTVGSQRPAPNFYATTGGDSMNLLALSIAGGNLPHNNLMPYLVVTFCIALQGIFPARS